MSSIEKAIEKLKQKTNQQKKHEPDFDQEKDRQINRGDSGRILPEDVPSDSDYKAETCPILKILEINNMVTPSLKDSRQVEEYRQIKRPLLSNISGKRTPPVERGNVIMVTSALPGEGKTYTTINLAMSIASERERSVLIVDCDVIRHSLSSLFGLDRHPGLIDALEGSVKSVRDIIVNTDVPSLKILPAGHSHNYSTELLASEEMGRLMDELAERYHDRIIIFDSPPLLLTSQSVVLTNHAGQIIVVVEEGVTPQKAVQESISKLDSGKVIGTVLNKRSKTSPGEGYGGYGGYYGIPGN